MPTSCFDSLCFQITICSKSLVIYYVITAARSSTRDVLRNAKWWRLSPATRRMSSEHIEAFARSKLRARKTLRSSATNRKRSPDFCRLQMRSKKTLRPRRLLRAKPPPPPLPRRPRSQAPKRPLPTTTTPRNLVRFVS